MFEAKVSATCRFQPQSGASSAQAHALKLIARAQALVLNSSISSLGHKLCQVSDARGFYDLLSVTESPQCWPGDKFLLLVKQVINGDLSIVKVAILYSSYANRIYKKLPRN